MSTKNITTKFMDMLNKRDNSLMQRILEAEGLDMDTLMDMFKAANNEYFAKLKVAGKTKKKRGPSAWTIVGAILRETVTTAVKEGDRGDGTPFVVAGKCLGKMWKSEDNALRKSDLEAKVGELAKNLEENEVLSGEEANEIAEQFFPKKAGLTCDPEDGGEAIMIKFDKALREKAVTVFMEKFGRIPVEEPAKPKKKTKGAKAKKDPNKPKRAKSAYIFFCSAMRATVKEEMGDAKATEVTRKLGKLWKQLTDEDKQPYQECAEADKKRYADEMEAYSGSSGGSGDEDVVEMEVDSEDEVDEVDDEVPKTPKKKKKKQAKAPGAPKKKKKSKSPVKKSKKKSKKSKSPVEKRSPPPPVDEMLDLLQTSSDDDE